MSTIAKFLACATVLGGTLAGAAQAQQLATVPAQQAPAPASASQAADAPERLVLYFPTGGVSIRAEDAALLDRASRLYRDGNPIVMIITGGTDTVGAPALNLLLSQQRATAVLNGLVARGIPAERFQILAKGQSELAVPTATGVDEARNRRVEITWR